MLSAFAPALTIEATCYPEILATAYQTKRFRTLEDRSLKLNLRENLKFNIYEEYKL
jgi:hypothetical protein